MTAQHLEGLVDLAEALAGVDFAGDAVVADPPLILSFLEALTGDAFDVPPERAIAYFSRKGLQPTFSYADMIGEEHDRAFTVAKMMDVDLLGQVRASLDSALANGTPFKEWAHDLMPMLQRAGWWGRKEVADPATGRVLQAELGSPWRLETIFRTNMQTAYAAGQWEEIEAMKDIAPYLMYDAIDDHRTRPSHHARDGTVLPVGHPWWSANTPPLGYNCRCGVIQFSGPDLQAMGIPISDVPPSLGEKAWTNPRTGEVSHWPDGVDPGFGRRPSAAQQAQALENLLDEKIQTLPPDMNAAATKGVSDEARSKATEEAMKVAAAGIRASTTAGALLSQAKRRARDAEKQVAAQVQLDSLDEKDGHLWQALQELSADPAWRALPAADRMRDVRRRARELERQG